MDAKKSRRHRRIESLRGLADPARNPDLGEVLSAQEKLRELLAEEKEVLKKEKERTVTWKHEDSAWERERRESEDLQAYLEGRSTRLQREAEDRQRTEVKTEQERLRKQREAEEIKLHVLFDWGRKPKSWEDGLFGYICKVNGCKAIVSHRSERFLLKAVGKISDSKQAEKQFTWAHNKVMTASRTLAANVIEELRTQYEHGAARELVKIMQETIKVKPNQEAVQWARFNLKARRTASPYTAINPYFSEGGRALKETF